MPNVVRNKGDSLRALGLQENPTEQEIKIKYHTLARVYHSTILVHTSYGPRTDFVKDSEIQRFFTYGKCQNAREAHNHSFC